MASVTTGKVSDPFVLSKLVEKQEYEYIVSARNIMGDLTGEDFVAASPEWLKFADMRLELDGYSDRLKIAIEYVSTGLYDLPPGLAYLYNDFPKYLKLLSYIDNARDIYSARASVATIILPPAGPRDVLRDYLRGELHRLTATRVWVGSPRCRCPSLMAADEPAFAAGQSTGGPRDNQPASAGATLNMETGDTIAEYNPFLPDD